jgi:serine/threonine protein kinase
MIVALQCDEALVRRLPLPLAQLYRRAHNAHRAKERKETAYCLWEAAIKLLGCVCVCEYAQLNVHDPRVDDTLHNLARPALGHWVGFIRQLLPILRDHQVPGFAALADALLRRRDDLPRVASLYAQLWEIVKKQPTQRTTVQPLELFDRLTEFRNQEVGHGAIGQRDEAFYTRIGNHLLAGAGDLLSRVDLLAGRRLYYLQDLRKDGGLWISHRLELEGQCARRVEPMTWAGERGTPPEPQAVYLDTHTPSQEPGVLCCLRPLVLYDEDDDHLLFLNSRTGNKKTEYLSYQSGKHVQRPDLGSEHRTLLRRILKLAALDEAQMAQWAEQLADQEKSEAGKTATTSEEKRRIGEFELLSELGRGGQSIVYRAVQPSLNREVALKRLLMAGNSHMDRHFLREIRALGRVDHPNLIKIYTSGVDHEQWYYAMELIEGANLGEISARLTTRSASSTDLDVTDWEDMLAVACEEARQGEKTLSSETRSPSPRPGSLPDISLPDAPPQMRERLAGQGYIERIVDLLRQVALAAHALHEAGIIHRDIKPANIMVDRNGTRAVLMDLGLAKLTDQSQISMSISMGRGGFVGTYRYASPEQANPQLAGSVDARSDVYSIGATLWELLTLKPLFGASGGNDPDLIRKIQQDDPPQLRSIHRKIHKDLEAIVARALEKKPSRRYSSAKELADDLQRYLNREPVKARPVGRLERWGRYVWRRPWESAFALVLITALGGVGVLLVNRWIDAAARQRVEAVNEVTLSALTDILDLLESDKFLRDDRLQPFRQTMLVSLRKLTDVMQNDPRGKGQLAGLFLRIGGICRSLNASTPEGQNSRQLAAEAYTKAIDLYGSLPQTPESQRGLIHAYLERASLEIDELQRGKADEDLHAAQRNLPKDPSQDPAMLDLAGEIAHQRGRLALAFGDADESARLFKRARQLRQDLLNRSTGSAAELRQINNNLARAHGYLGDAQCLQRDWTGAEESYRVSEQLREELHKEDKTNPEYTFQLARSYGNTANLERERFKTGGLAGVAKAIEAYLRAEKLQEHLLRANGAVADFKTDAIFNHLSLARLFLFRGALDSKQTAADTESARHYLEAAEKLLGPTAESGNEIRSIRRARSLLALLRSFDPKLALTPAEALTVLNEADVFYRQEKGNVDSGERYDLAMIEGQRARIARQQNKPDEADQHERAALEDLAAAWKEGYRNAAWAEKEPAFESVRQYHPQDWKGTVKESSGR